MNVGTICRREVVTVDPAEDLLKAAHLMRERHVGSLVVVAAGESSPDCKVVGMLTDRDIVTAVLAKDADARQLRVGDVMTRSPLQASEFSALEATLKHMREVGVRRVPVIGTRDQLVGILSFDDVLESLADQLMDVARAIRTEQKAERTARP
jgi:CBS domain-containing protein